MIKSGWALHMATFTRDYYQYARPRRPQVFQDLDRFIVPGNPSAATIDPISGLAEMFRNRTPEGMELRPDNANVTSGGGSIPWQDRFVNAGIPWPDGTLPLVPLDNGELLNQDSRNPDIWERIGSGCAACGGVEGSSGNGSDTGIPGNMPVPAPGNGPGAGNSGGGGGSSAGGSAGSPGTGGSPGTCYGTSCPQAGDPRPLAARYSPFHAIL